MQRPFLVLSLSLVAALSQAVLIDNFNDSFSITANSGSGYVAFSDVPTANTISGGRFAVTYITSGGANQSKVAFGSGQMDITANSPNFTAYNEYAIGASGYSIFSLSGNSILHIPVLYSDTTMGLYTFIRDSSQMSSTQINSMLTPSATPYIIDIDLAAGAPSVNLGSIDRFGITLNSFGMTANSHVVLGAIYADATATPEPASLACLALGSALLARRRRKS